MKTPPSIKGVIHGGAVDVGAVNGPIDGGAVAGGAVDVGAVNGPIDGGAVAGAIHPVAASERISSIDIARGAALFGVLLMNLEVDFRMPLARIATDFHTHPGWLDRAVDWCLDVMVGGKSLTVLSLLFGFGLAVQTERATSNGRSKIMLVRRMFILLVLGVLHLVLLWNGDILALYAVAGLVALIFVGRSSRAIAIAIGIIVVVSSLPFGGKGPLANDPDIARSIEQAIRTYSQGSYTEIVRFRWHETARQMLPLYAILLPRTVGMFLLGVLVYRKGIFQKPIEHRAFLRRVAIAGLALGATGSTLSALDRLELLSLGRGRNPTLAISVVPIALAYMAIFLLVVSRGDWQRRLAWLAPVGRMTLTNYLLQSVVLGFVFYGYGGGLFGRLSPSEALPIGVVLFAVQVVASDLWLRHFAFGPAEWVWRTLTYGERQAFRRA